MKQKNKKSPAKIYLSRYKTIDCEIDDLIKQKQDVEDMLYKITPNYSLMPSSHNTSNKISKGAEKLVEIEKELDYKIDELFKTRAEIVATIQNVDDSTLRLILTKHYISCQTLEQISIDIGYCYMQICRLHGKALEIVKKLIEKST